MKNFIVLMTSRECPWEQPIIDNIYADEKDAIQRKWHLGEENPDYRAFHCQLNQPLRKDVL